LFGVKLLGSFGQAQECRFAMRMLGRHVPILGARDVNGHATRFSNNEFPFAAVPHST
jgi:hypothetical protein